MLIWQARRKPGVAEDAVVALLRCQMHTETMRYLNIGTGKKISKIGLGTWQLQRKAWKEDLLGKIAQRIAAPPIRLGADVQSKVRVETDNLEYLHVAFRGRFHHDKERYLYAPARAGLGWHVYTPLE